MKIYVLPFGGLGNRLRVINSAKEFQTDYKANIQLIWLIKKELNIDINKLFSNIGFHVNFVKGLPLFLFLHIYKHSFINKYDKFYRFISKLFFDAVLFDSDITTKSQKELKDIIINHKKVLIATCYEFHSFSNFNNFQLQPDLQQKVEEITKSYSSFTFGVHIRRTDHHNLMKESPIDLYYQNIAYNCNKYPDSKFFIATDDLEVKTYLKEIYGDRILMQEIPLTRSSESGMTGAVIDIYCLAATQLIICNTNSSFAKMASLIGNKKEIIEVR